MHASRHGRKDVQDKLEALVAAEVAWNKHIKLMRIEIFTI